MSDPISRRRALRVLVVSGSALAIGCGAAEPPALRCDDVTGLSPSDADFRRGQGYVERSTRPGRTCDSCNFYQAGAASACGECTLIRGPINPAGYCNLWVQRT